VNVTRIASQLLLAVVLVATIGCDRVTKQIASRTLVGAPDRAFLAGTIRIGYAENAGGFLSIGADWSEPGRAAIFIVATGLLLAGMAVAMVRWREDPWALLGATLFLAGGASNWLDRVIHGHVVDFLNLGVGPLRTGVFNVADVAIMAGLALLLFTRLADERRAAR
jgi:signal peptidase II